jgi:hypothetical protein
MSVEDLDVVDFVSLSPDGHCLLTVSDHLDWQSSVDHQTKLQNKLYRYLDFLESGELFERYSEARGRKLIIEVRFFHVPDDDGLKFLSLIKETIQTAGFGFEYKFMSSAVN